MTFIRIAGRTGQEKGENFEDAISEYLIKRGYNKTDEPRRSSSGYEVDFKGKHGDTSVTVECKAHKNKIDLPLIAAFFGKYTRDRYEDEHCKGIFFSLSPLTDAAKQFYESIKKNEPNIPFEVITAEDLIKNLRELPDTNPPLEADYTTAKREFEKIVEKYNFILNHEVYIENKEENIFLEYLNGSYYWIGIVSSIKGRYFLILDKRAELPKDHKYLAEQLRETEDLLKDVKYLLAEKTELNTERLLEAIVYFERNNEWKYVFKNTIELLSKNGYLDILAELFENQTIRTTVSQNDVVSKIEEIAEKLLHGIENWKEDFPDVARCCVELFNFTFEYNVKNNEDKAVKNLEELVKIYSKKLVFDTPSRTESLGGISQCIQKLEKINEGKSAKCFEFAYKISKKALEILNSELEPDTWEENRLRLTDETIEADYPDPSLIELYECQKMLLEKARCEENASYIDEEISKLNNKIEEFRTVIESLTEPETE